MRVISTNTGRPRTYEWNGVTVRSSMRRDPTLDGLRIHFDRVEGDRFAVPKLHGIKEAVVYAFSAATFQTLSDLYAQPVGAGNVGENLTVDELLESEMMIGDEYDIGTARLRVTGPRYPCNRLNFCFQRENAMDLFREFRRPGVYFEVTREGHVQVGDVLSLAKSAGGDISVLALFDYLSALKDFRAGLIPHETIQPICEKVVKNHFVPIFHRERFQRFIL